MTIMKYPEYIIWENRPAKVIKISKCLYGDPPGPDSIDLKVEFIDKTTIMVCRDRNTHKEITEEEYNIALIMEA